MTLNEMLVLAPAEPFQPETLDTLAEIMAADHEMSGAL